MSLPRGRGRILNQHGRATIVAHCPLCGREHRYEKGEVGGEEIEQIRKRGFSDEWLPCQFDLPGNFWRVIVTSGRQSGKSQTQRRAKSVKSQ
jgi:hypothetical protein